MLERTPDTQEMTALLGQPQFEVWTRLRARVEQEYVMECLWDRGGKAWTYECKYRRGGKTLCTLLAKESRMGFLVIFGKKEREKFEVERADYSEPVQRLYDEAKTYHDGKWVLFEPVELGMIDEMIRLLKIKRKPNRKPPVSD